MRYSLVTCCLWVAVLSTPSVVAQRIQLPLKATLTLASSQSFTFLCAADPAATDSVDSQFNEVEIPDLPLPGDVFYVWTVAPTMPPIWLSPTDVRGYEEDVPTLIEYDLRVNWSGGTLTIAWDNVLPAGVDSAYIVDGFTTFPDNILSQKLVPGSSLVTNNPAIDRFKVLMWVSGSAVSVAETPMASPMATPIVYPNPATDLVSLSELSGGSAEICIVDPTGRVVHREFTTAQAVELQLHDVPAGIYRISIVTPTGVQSVPLIRL